MLRDTPTAASGGSSSWGSSSAGGGGGGNTRRLYVSTDRAQGVTSLRDGCLEVLLHRCVCVCV
jgi:hypothetical protein